MVRRKPAQVRVVGSNVNKSEGSSFDDFLKEENIYEESTAVARRKVAKYIGTIGPGGGESFWKECCPEGCSCVKGDHTCDCDHHCTCPDKSLAKAGPPQPGLVPQSGDPEHPVRWIRPKTDKPATDSPPTLQLKDIQVADYGPAPRLGHKLKGLARRMAEHSGDSDPFAELVSEEGDPGGIAYELDLNRVTDRMMASARKQLYEVTQESLIARGMPEEFWVFRGGSVDRPPTAITPVSLDPSVALAPYFAERAGSAAQVWAFKVKRADALLDMNAVTDYGRGGKPGEEEVLFQHDTLGEPTALAVAKDTLGRLVFKILAKNHGAMQDWPRHVSEMPDAVPIGRDEIDEELVGEKEDGLLVKAGPPSPGLVPQSGDPEHPIRWIRPKETKPTTVPTPLADWDTLSHEELSTALDNLSPDELYLLRDEINAARYYGEDGSSYTARAGMVSRRWRNKAVEAFKETLPEDNSALDEIEEQLTAELKGELPEEIHGDLVLRDRFFDDQTLVRRKLLVVKSFKGLLEIAGPESIASLAAEAREANFIVNTQEARNVMDAMTNHIGGVYPTIADHIVRSEVKDSVAKSLTSELESLADKDPELKAALTKRDPNVTYGFKDVNIYDRVDDLVHTWSESSADHHSVAIAMQLAAQEEFADSQGTMAHITGEGVKEGEARFEQNRVLYKAFHRAQYNTTQKWLKDNNITHLTLYRGAALPSKDVEATKKGSKVAGMAEVTTQPVSSFSADMSVARKFAHFTTKEDQTATVSVIRVPADRVLSTNMTGYGCLTEGEVTVLGGTDTALMFDVNELNRQIDVLGIGTKEPVMDMITRRLDEALND